MSANRSGTGFIPDALSLEARLVPRAPPSARLAGHVGKVDLLASQARLPSQSEAMGGPWKIVELLDRASVTVVFAMPRAMLIVAMFVPKTRSLRRLRVAMARSSWRVTGQ